MASSYHSQYPLLHIDLNQDHQELLLLSPKPAHHYQITYSSSSSSSVLLYPICINPDQDGAGYNCTYQGSSQIIPENQEKADTTVVSMAGSCDHNNPTASRLGWIKFSMTKKNDGVNDVRNQATGEGTNGDSAKWTSSKKRLMKKMTGCSSHQAVADHRMPESSMKDQEQASSFHPDTNNNTSNTFPVRVCSDCNTTKTPLWRSGPRGPKSLCNACGIRQRKARRRAMAAAATGTALAGGSTPPPLKPNKVQKKEKAASDSHLPLKKRSNNLESEGEVKKKKMKMKKKKMKMGFEDLPIILSKSSSFHQVFPQDEKDAAILLMALSYGLVHG